MLDYDDPDYMLRECQAAETHNLKHLASFDDMVQVMVGSYYREDMRPVDPSPENYPYTYVSNVRPRLVFNNPRFNGTDVSSMLGSHELIMQAKFVNTWAVQENLQQILIPFVTTGLLMRSVILTAFEEHPADTSLPTGTMRRMMPKCTLLENHRYFRDPVSTPAVKPRYKGHLWVRDLEDVKKLKDVDKEVLDRLIPDVELQKLQRPNDRRGSGNDMPARLEVVAYEVWVPECNDYATHKGHNGTLFTVACGQSVSSRGTQRTGKAQWLRKPRPYYGPKCGPYTELEFVDVPKQTYGTSPVSVVMQQVEEVNAHLSATADAASRMKNLVLIDAAQDTLSIAVQNSPDGAILGVPNITKDSIHEVKIGGPAPEQYEYNEVARARLDRNIGMDAAQRGGEENSKTATGINVQHESLNIRMADLKRVTAAAVKQIANTVAWYGWNSNNVVMPLSEADAKEMGIHVPPGHRAAYLGGPQQGQEQPDWDECALDLEPYSMEAIDEDKLAQEVAEALAIVAQLAQEMRDAPWLQWDVILEELGKLRKFDWLHECINGQLFAAWMQEQVQQGIEAHQSEQALTAAKIQGMQLDNELKKIDMMLRLKESGQPTEQKPPSVSIGYKDLPEDMKRLAEKEALGSSSTMPLTSPAHIQNQMDVHKTNTGMQHDRNKLAATQKHDLTKQNSQQQHQTRQSQLAGMFKQMGGQSGGKSGMNSRAARAQNGPTQTARKGQRALARSK